MVPETKLYKNERITELGIERRCPMCGEWLPADDEFYAKGKNGRRLYSYCRACNIERGQKRILKLYPNCKRHNIIEPIPILR